MTASYTTATQAATAAMLILAVYATWVVVVQLRWLAERIRVHVSRVRAWQRSRPRHAAPRGITWPPPAGTGAQPPWDTAPVPASVVASMVPDRRQP